MTTVSPAPGTLVFDGDCGFCTRCVGWMWRLGLSASVVVPWQRADLDLLGLTPEQSDAALQWVAPDGRVSSGAQAVARLLIANGPRWGLLGRVLLVPPVSWVAAAVYRWVAGHRSLLPGGTPACALPAASPPPGVTPTAPAPGASPP